ncbi:MAG TPA: hypothetical protein VFM05_06745 [Candidatus Saccharimonadales bacterium]|nr:hypothetical protein [Candidatus Saccharimonadales bacterium]
MDKPRTIPAQGGNYAALLVLGWSFSVPSILILILMAFRNAVLSFGALVVACILIAGLIALGLGLGRREVWKQAQPVSGIVAGKYMEISAYCQHNVPGEVPLDEFLGMQSTPHVSGVKATFWLKIDPMHPRQWPRWLQVSREEFDLYLAGSFYSPAEFS